MKKSALFFIIVIALCLTVLAAGITTGKVCPHKSYLCSSFTLAFMPNTVFARAEPATAYARTADPDPIYHREFLSSIFHPPKHIA